MAETKIYSHDDMPTEEQKQEVVSFLFEHLDQYGDPREDIEKCINYALKVTDSPGGFVVAHKDGDKMVGAVIVNETGMKGYIPENILVYIATHKDYRGKGVGKELMNKAIEKANGAIALHVEPDNPAKFLYEKLGFTNKYLEMRLSPKQS